jgi:hypothetical protein
MSRMTISPETRAILAGREEALQEQLNAMQTARTAARQTWEDLGTRIDAFTLDLAAVQSLLAQSVPGATALLRPADVTAPEDALNLTIGALTLSPGRNASAAQCRLYAGTMRVLCDRALHQARLATDTADGLDPDGAHVRRQAVTETANIPAYEPTPNQPGPEPTNGTDTAQIIRDALVPGVYPSGPAASGQFATMPDGAADA